MECWIFTFPYKKYLWGHFYPHCNQQTAKTNSQTIWACALYNWHNKEMLQIKPPGLSMAQKLHNTLPNLQYCNLYSTHLWSCKMVYNGYWTLSCWKMMLKSTLWFGFEIDSFGLRSNNRDQTSISSTGEVSIKTNKDDLLI